MNEFYVIGKVVSRPELSSTKSGMKLTTLIVQVINDFKNYKGVYDTNEFKVVAFRSIAQKIVEDVKTGSTIVVKGKLNANNYSNEGKTYYVPELFAEKITIIN